MKENNVIPFGVAPKSASFGDIHDGNMVSLTDDRLVLATVEGHLYSFRVSPDAAVCCDGTECASGDLKIGSKIRLTTKSDDKNIVTRIESLNEQAEFASGVQACATADGKLPVHSEHDSKPENSTHSHEGEVISVIGNKIVTSCHAGLEHSHTVAADAKVTCDGIVCRTQDLKTGAKIRLTTKPDDQQMATTIEALQKQTSFGASV
jgi:hypothetical protein